MSLSQKARELWHKHFWKLKALEKVTGIQSQRRALAVTDKVAEGLLLYDDGKAAAGQAPVPLGPHAEEDMGDSIHLGDVHNQPRESIVPALANLAGKALLAGSGLGAAYLAVDLAKDFLDRPQAAPVTEDTNDIFMFDLEPPKSD